MSGHATSHGPKHGPKAEKTDRPAWVPLVIAVPGLLTFGSFMFVDLMIWDNLLTGAFWGFIAACILYLATTNKYVIEVAGLKAVVLREAISGKLRVVFRGSHAKSMSEVVQKEVDGHAHVEEAATETYQTLAGMMTVKFVVELRANFHGPRASQNVLNFMPFKDIKAIWVLARSVASMLLSDHYAKNEPEALKDKKATGDMVFGENTPGGRILIDFGNDHGVTALVRIEDSDPAAQTQEAANIIMVARYSSEAVAELMKPNGDNPGMSKEAAEKYVQRLNLPNLSVMSFEGLENTSHVQLGAFPGFTPPKKDNDNKKGGQKR
jgi:hypothetical protein